MPFVIQQKRKEQIEAERLRRIKVMKVGVQLNSSPLKPAPEGLTDHGKNVELPIRNRKNVRVRFLIPAPDAVLGHAEHTCLISGEPRLGAVLKAMVATHLAIVPAG